MAAAPPLQTPVDESHHNPTSTRPLSSVSRSPGGTPVAHDFAMDQRNPPPGGRFTEDWEASQRGSSIIDGPRPRSTEPHQRPASRASTAAEDAALSRGNTLRKKSSLRRSGSLGRSGSRRSMNAGSVRSLALQPNSDPDEARSAFYCPVPTKGAPTDALAARFQGTASELFATSGDWVWVR